MQGTGNKNPEGAAIETLFTEETRCGQLLVVIRLIALYASAQGYSQMVVTSARANFIGDWGLTVYRYGPK
jgi:hypothetical protein